MCPVLEQLLHGPDSDSVLEAYQAEHIRGGVAVLVVCGDDPGHVEVLDARALDLGQPGDAEGEVRRTVDHRQDQVVRLWRAHNEGPGLVRARRQWESRAQSIPGSS